MAAELDGGGIYPPPRSRGGGLTLTTARHVVELHPSRSWVVGGTTHDREPISHHEPTSNEPQAGGRPLPASLPASRSAVVRSFGFSPIASSTTT